MPTGVVETGRFAAKKYDYKNIHTHLSTVFFEKVDKSGLSTDEK